MFSILSPKLSILLPKTPLCSPHSLLLPFLLFSASLVSCHSVDLSSLLPKAGVAVGGSVDSDLGVIADTPSAEGLGQSLVFTNSHHNGRTATHSYAHAAANSYAHAAAASTTYAHAALVCAHTHMYIHTYVSSMLAHVWHQGIVSD